MSLKPASISAINLVEQILLISIESENGLPPGLSGEKLTQAPWEPPQDLDLNQLRACILATVDLLKHRLLETAAAVCRRHNSLLPVQRLPPEIISTCISYAIAEIDSHNYQKRLIQLSSVSWWWRTVTLGTPSLWGIVHSKDPDWVVSLALDRSKDAPLTILYEAGSYSRNLAGNDSYRDSIASDDFFKLVSPYTNRWRDATLPYVGSGNASTDWLNEHKIQLSPQLRQLSLCWSGSASTENPITGFTGLAERLSDLKLHRLHIHPTDVTRILAASPQLVSLDLESLVALDTAENETRSESQPTDTFRPAINLPHLTRLHLKWVPSSILYPTVQDLNPTDKVKVSLVHNMREIDTTADLKPLASFIARLISTDRWVAVHPLSSNVTVRSRSCGTSDYNVELQGPLPSTLPWLRLHSMSQVTRECLVRVDIDSDELGSNPEPEVIESLMRFPKVAYVNILGSRESWRWAWLLSLPDAVQTESVGSEKRGGSWLWPNLKYLNVNGDFVNEFTLLSILLARYGLQSTGESIAQKNLAPCRLEGLLVRPRERTWKAEVLDHIRELTGPGCFEWFDRR